MKRTGVLLTSADAKPFKRQHQAPCSDCPWARKSLKGWTGPNSTATWLRAGADYWHRIVCHTRKRFAPVKADPSDRDGCSKMAREHWECAGAAIYRANIAAHVFPERGLLQLPANRITVFNNADEFRAHHGDGLPDSGG